MTTARLTCDLPCCTETWAPFESLLCAVQIFCPHNHGDVLATVFRVKETTSAGISITEYIGTKRERASTFTQYGVQAHVSPAPGYHRPASREEIEAGRSIGFLASDDEPHIKYVARCPRPSCNYRLQWSRPFEKGKLDKVTRRIENLLNHYADTHPGCTVRVTDIETSRDTQVSSFVFECYTRV